MMRIPRKLIKETKDLIQSISSEKLIHYRELYKDIDHTNFQISTKVDFKRVSKKNKGILKLWEQIKRDSDILNFHQSKSGSQYIITKQGDVYRLADHWGSVASCEWTIEGEGNLICSVFITGPLEIGVANLKDFTLFLRPHLPRKDYIINPEWKEKIEPVKYVLEKLALIKVQEAFKDYKVEDKILIGQSFCQFRRELGVLKWKSHENISK